MIFTYRVTLEGIKGFYRVYKVSSENSLYTFHKQLRSDLEFTVDQPILFKAFDSDGNLIAKYALIDMGSGSVDMIKMSDTVKAGVVKFIYYYDVSSKKSINITLEAQEQGCISSPVIVETKGPLPIDFENGYIAFEDRPEEHRTKSRIPDTEDEEMDEEMDDEEVVDEEDDDKEEEELIYDSSEE